MVDFTFIGTVVLNYKNYTDTIECVKSLKKLQYQNHYIIIVDNGSNNGSINILQMEFGKTNNIHIIGSDNNLGFAKGNNLGINYARKILGCDFVFVLNSDTIVPDGVFEKVVSVNFKNVGVISPSVINLYGEVSYPSENCDNIIKRAKTRSYSLYLAWVLSLPVINTIYNTYSAYKSDNVTLDKNAVFQNRRYVLQGCAYFLTPTFFKYYTQLYPETFLYWEEIDLLLYLEKVNLRSIVISTPPILHKEGQSTNELVQSKNIKRQVLKWSFDSYRKSKQLFTMSYEDIKKKYN